LPRRRVLVVDDVRASALTLAMMLERIGQEVAVAHDGTTAIKHVAAHRPDIIFLDIAMPEMNGYEVAHALRADEGASRAVLIALTGYGNAEARRKSSEAGFDHHLTKPTSIDELTELLRSLATAERSSSAPLAD
jgi:CheY-like chemotaxis protein